MNENVHLVQCVCHQKKSICKVDKDTQQLLLVNNFNSIYELALHSINTKISMIELVLNNLTTTKINYAELISQKAICIPVENVSPLSCYVTGTGLTHKNSELLRHDMYTQSDSENKMTDAQRIYLSGLRSGKATSKIASARPEWFFKGNGSSVIPTNQDLLLPEYAQGCGEEAELVAVYIVDHNGKPFRVGFTIGNEFSDHVLEKKNIYYLAQSKLFTCSIGPEIIIGDLPENISGTVKIMRNSDVYWEQKFNTGLEHMTHSFSNIEYYLFQHQLFNVPGNIYYHFLGADKVSFADNIVFEDQDVVDIYMDAFNYPLINRITKINPVMNDVEILK